MAIFVSNDPLVPFMALFSIGVYAVRRFVQSSNLKQWEVKPMAEERRIQEQRERRIRREKQRERRVRREDRQRQEQNRGQQEEPKKQKPE